MSRTRGWTRRRALSSMGTLVLSLGGHPRSLAAEIMAVRIWPAADYSRVTLESDTVLSAQHFLADNPPRLVVDIDGLALSPALKEVVGKVRADDPFIAGIRVGQFQPNVVRLVVDLKQAVAPQLFAIRPVAAYRHRLVFDLHPLTEPDPLLALIQDKNGSSSSQAAQAMQDELGEFIGKTEKARPAPGETVAKSAPPPSSAAERLDSLVVVALDPGHGGEDPGATGPSGLREKDVVLAIALQLKARLNEMPNMRAMLTRDRDYFVPLKDRVHKARQVQADLFVSIHADAFFKPQARGASVFALSQGAASSSTARWMASRENAADLVGGVNIKAQDATVLHTLLDMSTTAQIKDSLRLGDEVLGQIGKVGTLHKAKVEQAGFAVLKAPDIPSILVETAFISNPEEEAKLADPKYQARLVTALATGIQRYFAKNPPLARKRRL
ncbi:MAG: N-acetylmuramoyl-L-alanine amidase [Pseudomonadota bacterium]